jgi:hypothetical protein
MKDHQLIGKRISVGLGIVTLATVFQWLTHDLEHVARKLWQFVQEQDAIVRQRDLARTRNGSAANESSVGNRVVRRAKRAHADQSSAGIEHAGNTVNLGGLEGLFKGERRQDRGHA